MNRVAVIGAGIAGLTCAHELAKAGLDVTVYERRQSVGGRMDTRVKDGLAFDTGANFLVQAYRNIHRLAAELEVSIADCGPMAHVFLRNGKFRTLNMSSLGDALGLDGISMWTRLKLAGLALVTRLRHPGLDFFELSNVPESINQGTAYSASAARVGKEFADYVVDAFCSCMFFYRASEISGAAFYSLLNDFLNPRFDWSVQYAAGDMCALPRALARRLDVRLATPVEAVQTGPSGVAVVAADRVEAYDAAVLATTADCARSILRAPTREQSELLAGTRYSSTINVSFKVPRTVLGHTHCFYVPFIENPVVSEFTNEAVKGEHTARDGCTLVNVGLHESAALELLGAPDDAVYLAVKRELCAISPALASRAEQIVAHDLERWTAALPKYGAAHVARVKRFQAESQGANGIYLAGDYMNAPWIEGASRSGVAVARRILATQNRSPVRSE